MSEKIYGQFDLDTVEKLADIVNSRNLGEITIIDGDREITVKGKKCPPPPPAMPPMAAAPAAVQQQEPAAQVLEKSASAVSGNQVKAPIVGTFYAAPSPNDKPFVTVGQQVKKGDTIFIIESMKVMSEVQSEFDGVVKEILVNDGDSLEFDQTVMIIG
ncbi:acetyl-CoA carboxylase biotin carboxyl carrier protein [Ruminococcus sp. Marseille-P6503]|uniref:acetyl-CoA carboxylase biotin carboxyl carrier protein n=1 Tax=Ruminococcus sp. Marseille-P6503 TaxID=2364796 RepID=UPI000F535D9E|nr:acetyl-CoA carboxylase biotin carboxyl carrier protein [Ruminococcus sp. Marseille-P6503]